MGDLLMIEIKGKNLILRTVTQKEMRALLRKYEPQKGKPFAYDEEKADEIFLRISQREERSPSVGIFTKTDEIIGQLTFDNLVYSEKRCDLFFFLANSSYFGKGFEAEAVTMAKRYAKDKMGLKKMYAEASSKNLTLQSILKECGFNHTKTFPKGAKDGGDLLTFFTIL